MKSRSQGHALLVELLIVVLFFMLAATMLLQVFAKARSQGDRAGVINDALVGAQNTADRLYAVIEEENGAIRTLQEMGFEADAASGWALEEADFRLLVYLETEDRPAGLMQKAEVQAYQGDELLFTLPVARYEEAQK